MSDMKKLYDQRLARYQAAIACEPVDRVPLASGSNYYAEVYAGYSKQEIIYEPEKWLDSELKFAKAYPAVDVLRNNRIYGPLYDALGVRNYKLPGIGLKEDTPFQFVEKEYLLAEEYDDFIADPTGTMIKKVCPRLHSEEDGPYTIRMANAFLKAGMAQAAFGAHMRRRTMALADECGMPQPMGGGFAAPLDALSDTLRDMKGIMMDMRRRPEKVLAACEALVAPMVNIALGTGDPFKRWPIFVPTHKPMFLSPKEYDKFYWPSFKKVLEGIIASGHKVRCYLEGNQDAHVHHFKELPKGTVLLDIDAQSDIFKVKEIIGDHQCIAGGLNDSMLIIGTPDKIRERVKELCSTLGQKPGFMISGSCNFPFDTKPENFQALCEAVEEYGWLDKNRKLSVKTAPEGKRPAPMQITPWEVKKAETGVQGNEAIVKASWDALENQAHTFWWQWAF